MARGKGEGSLFKRADGKWVACVDLGWKEGKRRRRTAIARTRPEAVKKLKALLAEQEAGVLVAGNNQTLQTFLDSWLEGTIRGQLAFNSYEAYRSACHNYIIPHLGTISLQSLTGQQVEKAKGIMLAEGATKQSTRYALRVLRLALNRALRWGLVSRNVALSVDLPRVRPKETKAFSKEEATRFLAACEGHQAANMFKLILALALRKSEALGLRWQDVDLDKGLVHIRASLQRGDNGAELVAPKSQRAARTLHLPALGREALEAQRAGQHPPGEYVFTNYRGAPYDERMINHYFNQICKREGLPLITVHGLRHTTSTLLLMEGTPVHVVSELLGHSSVLITLSVYAHVLEGMKADVALTIDAIYSSAV